ncbi:hypothetical protein ACLMJK_004831 [Lecanora helva]
MLSLLFPSIPRTLTATSNPISTEDGASTFEFFSNNPTAKFAMKGRQKPGETINVPPYHWHKYQTETFLIHSGVMRATVEGADKFMHAGQSVTIEPGVYHTYHNGSETEDLILSTGLDPAERERDEAFFRNLTSYLDDCRKAHRAPQTPQLFLFLYFFDCYLALPGPKPIMKPVSQALVFFVGVVIGKWLLGMKESYPEYYKKASE